MPLISDIRKSLGVSTLVAPGISLATDTYGAPEVTSAPTSAFVIDAMMERTGMAMRVNFNGASPDGQVEWFVNGNAQAVLGPSVDFTPAMEMGAEQQIVTAAFAIGGEAQSSVPLPLLHAHGGMGHAGHNLAAEQDYILGLVRHVDATVIALADGDWSDPAIWSTGKVPGLHARILVPYGRSLRYDNTIPVRHDTLRVDGVLNFATDQTTQELVETFVVHPAGEVTIGTGFGDRLPAQHEAKIVISNRDVRIDPDNPGYIDLTRDPNKWGRGLIAMGKMVTFGHDRATHVMTAERAYPQAGDTSVLLAVEPRGWQVGDMIVVPGTAVDLNSAGVNTRYDEERVITAIADEGASGWRVSFATPLLHTHGENFATDLLDSPQQSIDIINLTKNIIIESEEPEGGDVQRRGHFIWHGDMADFDIWDMASIRMGRTDKSIDAGQVDGNGDFEFVPQEPAYSKPQSMALAANSNITGRYAFHAHMNGTDSTKRRLVRECLTVDNKGWGKVHHAGTVDWVKCVMYRVQGAGMVSETGNEFGRWQDCVIAGLETTNGAYAPPKIIEDTGGGKEGNLARTGYGFFYRSRTMIILQCRAYGMTLGHVFYHRGFNNGFSDRIHPLRSDVDMNDMDINSGSGELDEFSFVNYPIVHFRHNVSWGCWSGFGVVKGHPRQHHNWNVQIKDFAAISCARAVDLDYIGSYLIRRIYASFTNFAPQTDYSSDGFCISMGNPGIIGFDEITGHGFEYGIFFAKNTLATNNFTLDNPHYVVGRTNFTGARIEFVAIDRDVSFILVPYDDPQSDVIGTVRFVPEGDIIDGVPPTVDLPFVIHRWDGGSFNEYLTGTKSDTGIVSSPLPSPLDPFGVIREMEFGYSVSRIPLRNTYGTFTVTDPDDGQDKICQLIPLYWGDSLTAYPLKTLHAYEYTGTNATYLPGGAGHNGTLAKRDAPIERADISVSVPRGGTINLNAITEGAGTTAGTGAVLTLDQPWFHNNPDVPLPWPPHLKPDYCKATVSGNGDIALTGPEDLIPYGDTEEMWVFIYDGALDFKAVKITITVT